MTSAALWCGFRTFLASTLLQVGCDSPCRPSLAVNLYAKRCNTPLLCKELRKKLPYSWPTENALRITIEEQSCPLLLRVPICHNLRSCLRNQSRYCKKSAQPWASPLRSYTTTSDTKAAYKVALCLNWMRLSLPFNFFCLCFFSVPLPFCK